MNSQPGRTRIRGFTLLETITALTLGGVLLAGGIPALGGLIARNRITGETNSFVAHLQLTRSTAIKTGLRTVLCPSADGIQCLGSRDWRRGYMVFVDKDSDRRRDADENVVNFHQIETPSVKVDAGRRRTVTYQSTGWAPGSNLTVTFCDATGRAPAKAAVVSSTGRPRVTDTHPNGSGLSCS